MHGSWRWKKGVEVLISLVEFNEPQYSSQILKGSWRLVFAFLRLKSRTFRYSFVTAKPAHVEAARAFFPPSRKATRTSDFCMGMQERRDVIIMHGTEIFVSLWTLRSWFAAVRLQRYSIRFGFLCICEFKFNSNSESFYYT